MLIKICGITNTNDANLALSTGADWIGLNLVDGPRKIDLPTAAMIIKSLSEPARAVVLYFVKEEQIDPDVLTEFTDSGVRRLQLYGRVNSQTICQCAQAGLDTIYVQPLENKYSFDMLKTFLDQCDETRPDYILFDAVSINQLGGTGRQVDWKVLEMSRNMGDFDHWPPVILAGGLNPDNVSDAVHLVQPAGIDVCSGVESSPGVKDQTKIKRLIEQARNNF